MCATLNWIYKWFHNRRQRAPPQPAFCDLNVSLLEHLHQLNDTTRQDTVVQRHLAGLPLIICSASMRLVDT